MSTKQCSFRQVDERHVTSEVDWMEWSPKMDLIALANIQGEVLLRRLSWQAVWTLTPDEDEPRVGALSWRPDGKVLAVGYKSGRVVLCDVENSDILHAFCVGISVTSLQWVSEGTDSMLPESNQVPFYKDNSSTFLPKQPSLSRSYGSSGKHSEENAEDQKKLKSQTRLNVLVIGTKLGDLYLYAYGVLPCGIINISSHTVLKNTRVLSATISNDLSLLSVLVENIESEKEEEACLITFSTPLLASRYQELQVLAKKFGQISSLMGYLDSTIHSMSEAWEDILLEMDSRLTKFAEDKFMNKSGTVSDDFLELLMFGTPSDELEHFLLHVLTEKGLKKLGHSIDNSYTNIQKLVLKHLQSVGQALVYHLSELKGMSLWYDKFGILGLSTKSIQEALSSAGSFMLKAIEIQQVIDSSIKNFKSFFRWLYVVILRLSDEPIPPEINKITQQDLNFVAEFLKENFTEEWSEGKKSNFNLERVGQYLKNAPLSFPSNEVRPWQLFLASNPEIQNSSLIYPHYPEKSLVQQHLDLKNTLDSAITQSAGVIGQSINCLSVYPLWKTPLRDAKEKDKNSVRIAQLIALQVLGYQLTVFTSSPPPSESIYVIRQKTKTPSFTPPLELEAVCIYFKEMYTERNEGTSRSLMHKILDVKFYNEKTLSLLLLEDQEDGQPELVQFPLHAVEDCLYTTINMIPSAVVPLVTDPKIQRIDGGPYIDNLNHRILEKIKVKNLAVSGSRKVTCVLFASRRRVRFFEMDVEDEDEDDERTEDESTERELQDSQKNDDEDKENSLNSLEQS